ncbi:MAG TPA: tRNA (adenosine(37)-N6)-threonylcarbamoyltransferase complex dimerization subunit type 1 TsaB [Gammaproteobacteria bacterium]|nr:tRNA (adenosine(37)-N6)-threonylcarbamoyltransferase complex dimerization subunit type 1 TsaB [Gammaproteobacteria bacterium]
MKLLGIETSSAAGSVALRLPEGIAVRTIATPREQTERLLALADELLADAGLTLRALDGIAFGRGPGSFSGLRVAAAVAQGFAAPSGVPLLPVSSLLCLAQGAFRTAGARRSLVCVDAHMGEAYWGEFEVRDGLAEPAGPERLGAPAEIAPAWAAGWTAVGDGLAAHRAALEALATSAERVLPDLKPAAEDLFPQAERDLAAGRAVGAAQALPVYLREHTAWRRSS